MDKNEKIVKLEEELKLKQVHECEVYSRIVGYFRPIVQWNNGKAAEFTQRKTFDTAVH